jgi:homocysteine S-methyltransferase
VHDPLEPFLRDGGALVLDGGLATELEKAGFDLAHPLWSARLLREAPEAIAEVHRAYLEAGADCITTASYQATVRGFERLGSTAAEAESLLRRSVDLALEARDAFWAGAGAGAALREVRRRPLVAASVGPYGAYRADGSEYTGAYDLDESGLVAFHRERLHLLAKTGADLLACETIPSLAEARALVRLLADLPEGRAWVSFSCRDGERLSDGTPFANAVAEIARSTQVEAVGVNCTAPAHVEGLLRAAAAVTSKPLIAYPNSGESYDAIAKAWRGLSDAADWGQRGLAWRAAGARLLGGCCRTGPSHVRALRAALSG